MKYDTPSMQITYIEHENVMTMFGSTDIGETNTDGSDTENMWD